MAVDERTAKSRDFIQRPDEWPIWPRLPLKRNYRLSPNAAFIWGDPFNIDGVLTVRVYFGNIFAPIETLGFPSVVKVDDLLAQGWVVD